MTADSGACALTGVAERGGVEFGGVPRDAKMSRQIELDELVALLGELDVAVRYAALGGEGGGLCTVRGRQELFVDIDADVATQIERTLGAVASRSEIDNMHVPPHIRAGIDRIRSGD